MKKHRLFLEILLFSLIAIVSLYAEDIVHFYRATPLFPEPRFERDLLFSIDVSIGGGATSTARNGRGDLVPLFSIFGPQELIGMNIGLPPLQISDLDQKIHELNTLYAQGVRQYTDLDGHFSITEGYIQLTSTILYGIIAQVVLPIRTLHLGPEISQSPAAQVVTTHESLGAWLDRLLSTYHINNTPYHKTGIGDLAALIGWTINYQDTNTIDFVDFTIKAGCTMPTGKKRDPYVLYSLPHGYNGHWGFPITTQFSIGIFDWITIGIHGEIIPFTSRTQTVAMKTDPSQSGYMKLAYSDAQVALGTHWWYGLYLKADHVVKGFSLTCAYSNAGQRDTQLTPLNTQFSTAIINNDPAYAGWNMHTVHLGAEYDFTKEGDAIGPRVSFYSNLPVSGTRIFNTTMNGFGIGIDFVFR